MRKKKLYLVGLNDDDWQVVYGTDETYPYRKAQWANPLTLFQAQRMQKKFNKSHKKIEKLLQQNNSKFKKEEAVIYKLVKVKGLQK